MLSSKGVTYNQTRSIPTARPEAAAAIRRATTPMVTWRYVYDDENMPTRVYKTPAGGSEALVEEYAYGADGLRTRKIRPRGAWVTTPFC